LTSTKRHGKKNRKLTESEDIVIDLRGEKGLSFQVELES
jgi:hypothetical protein